MLVWGQPPRLSSQAERDLTLDRDGIGKGTTSVVPLKANKDAGFSP